LYGAFVWARAAINRRKWWFPARAVQSFEMLSALAATGERDGVAF
jgi:hypothetical protein